jgi:hypothetical protein
MTHDNPPSKNVGAMDPDLSAPEPTRKRPYAPPVLTLETEAAQHTRKTIVVNDMIETHQYHSSSFEVYS